MMRPVSSNTSTPSSMVLNNVSKKLRSLARRRTTVCKPCASRRPIRPNTLSKKLDFAAIVALVDEHELVREKKHLNVRRPGVQRLQWRLSRTGKIGLRVPLPNLRRPLEPVLHGVLAAGNDKVDCFARAD